MNILSRRKRLLNRTSTRANSVPYRNWLRRVVRRNRASAPAMPKMSSRRQFHRALRRHPAWPAVMEQAAARARAQENIRRERSGITAMGQASTRARLQRIFLRNRSGLHRFALPVAPSIKNLWPDTASAAWRRSKLRKRIRRNRVLVVTVLVVGGLVALLTGISVGSGAWFPNVYDLSVPPSARFGSASAYDEARGEIVLFGGFVGTTSASNVSGVSGPPILNDNKTYLHKGSIGGGEATLSSGWGRRDTVQTPSARGFAAMAYDGARRNVVLFGGAPYNTDNVSGETWIWDGQDWTLQNPPEPVPDPRQNAAMVYDAHHNGGVVMMFGGRGADGKPMNDTWIWNGTRWKVMPPEGAPSPRHSAAITYDTCRAKAIMFGGVGDPINNFHRAPSETWTWDGAKWTPEAPLLSPPGRVGAGMAYSDRTGNVLLYGGLTANDAGVPSVAADHDIWRWVPKVPHPSGLPPGGPTQNGFWERMNTERGIKDDIVFAQLVLGDFQLRSPPPPPRAYALFLSTRERSGLYGSHFSLFGGTPSANAGGLQLALGDQYWFGDSGQGDVDQRLSSGGSQSTNPVDNQVNDLIMPIIRECPHPVPLHESAPGAAEVDVPQDSKAEVREGIREIGQLPVLLGADWPQANRDTHLFGNPRPVNPNYTPAPDCPNRSNPNQSGFNATSGNTETGGSTHLATDSTRNRVYQFFVCDPNRGQGYNTPTSYGNRPEVYNLLIETYDGTTLKPLGKAIARNVRNDGSKTLIHDPAQDRFLVRTSTTPFELVSIQKDRVEKGLDPVGGRYTFSASDLSGKTFMNFFRHPTTGLPKLFYLRPGGGATAGPPPATSTPPKLGQWDLEGMKSDWETPAPSACTGGSGQDTLGPVNFVGASGNVAMRSGERVYTTCHVGNSQWAVLKISLTGNAAGSETPGTTEVFPGPYGNVDSMRLWEDPQAERMIIEVPVNFDKKIWIFDGKVSRWVGRTGLGKDGIVFGRINPITLGFDDSAGRLYVHMADSPNGNTQGGVRIVDTRLTPVAQPVNFPQFASPAAISPASLAGPGVARRVFIRVGQGKMKKYPNWETVEFKNEMFYRVLADEMPVPKPSSLSGLDALTVPVAETPGKTDVSFDAEGSAYGIRLRSIGGIWTAARPFQQAFSGNMDLATESTAMPLIRHLIPACVFPDRELMAGFVPQARLSDLDALARSSGLEVDSNSKVDLTGPSSRCQPTADSSNFPPSAKVVFDVLWPLKLMVEPEVNKAASSGVTATAGQQSGATSTYFDSPAGSLELFKDAGGKPTGATATTTSSAWDKHFKEVVCVGDALKTYRAAVGNIYGSSECKQTKGLVDASARGSATGVGPLAEEATKQGFSVGEGYSTVTVAREPVRGVVVTSTATAKGIQLPHLTIGMVKTEAVVWSNGRPGEKRASFKRTICRVTTPDFDHEKECLTDGSNGTVDEQQDFVNMWNSRGGKNSQMYLPKPDPGYYQGSPGGYVAGVMKPVAQEVEDQLFAKDFQKEVPGLEIHFYKDSQYQGDARQTLQLAAVRAVAGLGVQCNPDHVYSPQTKTTPATCLLLTFDDDLGGAFDESEEDEFFEGAEDVEAVDGYWATPQVPALALGKKIGRFIANLPLINRLPIRSMGEALLAASVWLLLGAPLVLAYRRLSIW